MEKVIIEAYQFKELNKRAQLEAIYWLDKDPIEYEDENGIIQIYYFAESSDDEISEHCEINNYLFSIYGKPIHHLIKGSINE